MASSPQKRDWEKLYREYAASGLKLSDFAQGAGISYNWLSKKFRSMKLAGIVPSEPVPAAEEISEPEFVPLTISGSEPAQKYLQPENIRITIGKAVLEIPCNLEEDLFEQILKAVLEAC